jgi:hypothetical protein
VPETPIVPNVAGVTVTRSEQYRSVFSDIYRARVGIGEVSLVFSRVTHTPSITAEANVVEEQVEIVLGWPSIKMLQMHLSALVSGIEQEIGQIPVPNVFLSNSNPNINPTAQAGVIRTLGLSRSSATEPPATKEEETP